MGSPFRIRDRIPSQDDSYLLSLIKENLGHYPSSLGLTDEKIIGLLSQYTRVIILMARKGERIGFLSWTEKKNVFMLELCVIDPTYQRKGIATHYITKLEKFAKRQGFDTIRFYVDLKNEEALKLYKRFGFLPKRMNPFANTLLMEKKLL